MILSLRKSERLYLRKSIDTLFSSGERFFVYPYKVLWKEVPLANVPLAWMISVPKRTIRLASSRNLIKRRSREIYRKSKPLLAEALHSRGRAFHLAFIYCGKEAMTSRELEPKIQMILNELIQLVEKGS